MTDEPSPSSTVDASVAMTGYGVYVPDDVVTGEAIAAESGIPEEVVVEKMGVREKHVCPPDGDHVTDMCVTAAEDALAARGVDVVSLEVLAENARAREFYDREGYAEQRVVVEKRVDVETDTKGNLGE